MFSAKDDADSFGNKQTHRTTGAGGKGSELVDSQGRKQTHQTTGEEEDLPDRSNMQVLMLQNDSHLTECNCATLYHYRSFFFGGGEGAGQDCTRYIYR